MRGLLGGPAPEPDTKAVSTRRPPRAGISIVTLLVGTVLTAAASLGSYFFPESPEVLAALLIALLGIVITLLLDHRVKLGDLERMQSANDQDAGLRDLIAARADTDALFAQKYVELRQEISDLADGKYRIRSLQSLYLDDVRSIGALTKGETLYSTCPVSPASEDDALRQISEPYYAASIEAHVQAARREVAVTRIYLLKNARYYRNAEIRSHLWTLQAGGIAVRVILRDETALEGEFDYLVFGSRKVSVGVAEPGAGTVSGAIAYTDRVTVGRYADAYKKMVLVSSTLAELDERFHTAPGGE